MTEEEKSVRLTRLIELQHRISGEIHDRWIGREVEVLVEGPARRNARQLYGRTEHFRAVVFPDDGTPAGSLRKVRVVGATPLTLFGETVSRSIPAPAVVQIA